jgi:hypothetical protein
VSNSDDLDGRAPGGHPSGEVGEILSIGTTDATTVFVSFSTRDPGGRDAQYLAWHALDHRPEQHRLRGLRHSFRLVSTPACRAARAAAQPPYDEVDHVMAYLFADRSALEPFQSLGKALGGAGRMPLRLPSVALEVYDRAGMAASRSVLVGADVVPWRPSTGAYLLIERGKASPASVCEVPGVAGVWWFRRPAAGPTPAAQLTCCFLDDDPVAVADRLHPWLAARRRGGSRAPLLAAPFLTPVPYEWDRHLP